MFRPIIQINISGRKWSWGTEDVFDRCQSIKFTRLPSLYIYHAPAGAWTELYRIILNYTEFYRGIFPVSWLLSRNLESGLCSVTFKCHLIKSTVCSHAVHVHSHGDKNSTFTPIIRYVEHLWGITHLRKKILWGITHSAKILWGTTHFSG